MCNQALSFLSFVLLSLGCASSPEAFPTEAQVEEKQEQIDEAELPPAYQTLYASHGLPKPSALGQQVRALIWLQRMNLTQSQLTQLESVWRMAQERHQQLLTLEKNTAEQIKAQEIPIYQSIWDNLKSGKSIDSEPITEAIQQLQSIRDNSPRTDIITRRIEGIQSIMQSQQAFLSTLTPEQELVIVDALFFLRHKLDPVANPEDFSILIGNMYNPGQFAVLTKGMSKVAQQDMNIGGLWTDEPVLTGRELHEARRESILYLALLEPALGEAIVTARSQ